MRLLVITNYYPPCYKGGYELACRDNCEFLASRGHQVFVLTGFYGLEGPEKAVDFTDNTVRALRYINYEKPSVLDKHKVERHNYRVTLEAIRRVQPDLVYIWNMQAVSPAPVLAAQDSGVKRIFEIGDLWPQIYADYSFFDTVKRRVKAALPFTVAGRLEISPVISVSDWIGYEMADKYGSKAVYSIPRGIKPPENIKKQRNEGITKYIFTGRIDPQKGIDTSINALGKLAKDGKISDFVYDIYGSGDKDWLEHCRRLTQEYGLDKQIRFCGKVDVNDLKERYADYDIMLMPTMMREPFGIVTVEAMAAGLAVIATNHYGPAEIIDDGINGLLFAPGNADDLAEKILTLEKDNALYERLRLAARQKFLDKYQFETIKAKVEQVLKAQINGKDNEVSGSARIV